MGQIPRIDGDLLVGRTSVERLEIGGLLPDVFGGKHVVIADDWEPT